MASATAVAPPGAGMGRAFRVPYRAQGSTYGEAEVEAVRRVLASGATLSCGVERSTFEREFAGFVGVDPALAVATSSCTVALEIATYLLELRPGDNVIVTPQSYQSTLTPLFVLDVEVRFADIDRETLCLDPATVEPLLDDRTRAVYLTHYGGLMADLAGFREVLADRPVHVVEDCAHAHGAGRDGRRAGGDGNIACYSFQSMKNMSTLGQGGMMLLPDAVSAARVRRLIAVEPDADFALRPAPHRLGPYGDGSAAVFTHQKNAFTHDCTALRRHGTNSTLPEPAAAVGRVQLARLGEHLARRRQIAEALDRGLDGLVGVRPQRTPAGYIHAHHLYTCFVDPRLGNAAVAAALVERGIEIQQRYFPLHLLPEWRARGGRIGQCLIAEEVWFGEQLNLPIYPAMSDEQVEHVLASLGEVLASA